MLPRFKIQYPMKNQGKDAPTGPSVARDIISFNKKAKVDTLARF